MSLMNNKSLTTNCEVNDAKVKILKSVIDSIDDPELVLKVVNEALMSEFDVWSSIIEKSLRKTKDSLKERMDPSEAKEFNSLLVKKVIEEVSLIFTEFKCFMEGCVATVDSTSDGIRLPDQLSRASNKPLDQCYVALDHGSVSRFYKHIWMQERKEVLRMVLPTLSHPSAPSDSSSDESEDIVDDVSDFSGEGFEDLVHDFNKPRGEGMASTSVLANGTLDLEDKKDISLCEPISNAPELENGRSTEAPKPSRKRKRSKMPVRRYKNMYFCNVTNCTVEPNKSWSSSQLAWDHYLAYHDNRAVRNIPCGFCSKKFATQDALSVHLRYIHKSASENNDSTLRKELIVSITKLSPDTLRKVIGNESKVDYTLKKKVNRQRLKTVKLKGWDKLPVEKIYNRFFCRVAGCSVDKSWGCFSGICYHLSSNHGDEDFCDKPCDMCNKKFPTYSSLGYHKKRCH